VVFRSYHSTLGDNRRAQQDSQNEGNIVAMEAEDAAVPVLVTAIGVLSDEQGKNHCESAWSIHWLVKIQKYINGRHSSRSGFGEIRESSESWCLGMDGEL